LIGNNILLLGQLTQTYKILKKHDNDKKFQMVTIGFFNLVACNSDDVVVVSNSSDGLPLTAWVANFQNMLH
jgi:hypothetical protein